MWVCTHLWMHETDARSYVRTLFLCGDWGRYHFQIQNCFILLITLRCLFHRLLAPPSSYKSRQSLTAMKHLESGNLNPSPFSCVARILSAELFLQPVHLTNITGVFWTQSTNLVVTLQLRQSQRCYPALLVMWPRFQRFSTCSIGPTWETHLKFKTADLTQAFIPDLLLLSSKHRCFFPNHL